MNASAVIRIGRIRIFTARRAASIASSPASRRFCANAGTEVATDNVQRLRAGQKVDVAPGQAAPADASDAGAGQPPDAG